MNQEIIKKSEYRIEHLHKDVQLDPEYYNDWEKQFVDSLFRQERPLSDKQVGALDKLWEKHLKR